VSVLDNEHFTLASSIIQIRQSRTNSRIHEEARKYESLRLCRYRMRKTTSRYFFRFSSASAQETREEIIGETRSFIARGRAVLRRLHQHRTLNNILEIWVPAKSQHAMSIDIARKKSSHGPKHTRGSLRESRVNIEGHACQA
jgi:hypothetical protein